MWKKWILLPIGLAMLCMSSLAQAQTKDVPETAQWEIQRRGNHVERTGTIRSGLMAQALSPPTDDSQKWFLTLVVKDGDADSERMKAVFQNDPAMKPWVDVHDSGRSQMHFQLRKIDDRTQADWLSGLKPAIDRAGLPVVVLQPPRSGQFGDPKRIVKMIHGICSGKDLADKLRAGVIDYINEIEIPNDRGLIGVPAPFNVQPPPPVQPAVNPPASLPFEWPASKPQEVTIEQIQAACPGASPDFVLSMISEKVTSLEIVKLRWMVYQSNKSKPTEEGCIPPAAVTEKVQPESPFLVSSLWPLATLGMLILGMMIGCGAMYFRTKPTNSLAARFDALTAAVATSNPTNYTTYPNQTPFPQYQPQQLAPAGTQLPSGLQPGLQPVKPG